MRLKCEVDVMFRPVAGCSVRKSSRPCQAIITVGREGGGQSKTAKINMLISTGGNRHGTKYQLSGNIIKLYARFVEEGKGTISLVNPAQDICISKADPLQLKSLLTVLRLVAKGDDVSKVLSVGSVQPPSTNGMKALQTSMVITSRKDYPLTTTFPSALQNLTVNGCKMKRLDPRILDLRHLQTLTLADNLLTTFPNPPGRWTNLRELDLSSNQLAEFPPVLFRSGLNNTLSVLNLNNNSLQRLPPQLCEMRSLVRLHVDENKITAIPPTIGTLSRLYILSAQRNQITQLPACMTRLRLESLDLFGNPIQQIEDSIVLSSNLGVPSLREQTARFIRKEGLAYSEEDILPQLVFYLNNARLCWCGRYCFESCARYLTKCELSKLSSTVRAWDEAGRTCVPVETFLCSESCAAKFKKNAFAYWR
ncbi:leucine-rich repeat protein 1-like [Littorina saxatilis]|uniref:PIF1/LRR1 pleckstrin homology domain-containing protein n=1 Tax=Littorina saxatilis TaxID=31220 RepID=A0AAN9BDR8_9CAEN